MNNLNSFLNALLQLLAAVPIIAETAAMTDLGKVDNKFVRELLRSIDVMWSGRYRILDVGELYKELLREDESFLSYRNKTSQHLLYFVVKKLMEEISFVEN
jgi:hypothetical protein